jgi:hypothetical protein
MDDIINPLKAEINFDRPVFQHFSPVGDQSASAVRELITLCSENRTEHVSSLCG